MTYTKPARLYPADAKRLKRIPQEDMRWQVAYFHHTLADGTPNKTPLFYNIIEQQTPRPLTLPMLFKELLSPKLALEALTQAIELPFDGAPARPTTITISDEELFAWLKPSADQLDIELILGPTPELESIARHLNDKPVDYTQAPGFSKDLFERVFKAGERFIASKAPNHYFPSALDVFRIARDGQPTLYALTNLGERHRNLFITISPDPELIFQYQDVVLGTSLDELPTDEVVTLFFNDLKPDSPDERAYMPGARDLGWTGSLTPSFDAYGEELPDAQALQDLELGMLAISAATAILTQDHQRSIHVDIDADQPHELTITLDELPDTPTLHLTVPFTQALTDDGFDPTLTFDQIEDLHAWTMALLDRFERTFYYRRLTFKVEPVTKWCMAKIIANAMAHKRASLGTLTIDDIKHGILTTLQDEDLDEIITNEVTTDLEYVFTFIKDRLHIPNDALHDAFHELEDPQDPHSSNVFLEWVIEVTDHYAEQYDYHYSAADLIRALTLASGSAPHGHITSDKTTNSKPSKAKKKAKNKQQRASRKKNRKKK